MLDRFTASVAVEYAHVLRRAVDDNGLVADSTSMPLAWCCAGS